MKYLNVSRQQRDDFGSPFLIGCPGRGGSGGAEPRAGRFHNVTELRLSGLDLTDAASRLLVRFVPRLAKLDLSHCANVSDHSVATLAAPTSPLRHTLTHLNLAGMLATRSASTVSMFCGPPKQIKWRSSNSLVNCQVIKY